MTMNGSGHALNARAEDGSPHWRALLVLVAAAFMNLLDMTIVNVAIPSIRSGLAATYTDIQWVSAGYIVAFALALITGGRLGDMLGRRRLFLIGTASFVAASLLCGLAPNPSLLIASRVLQGIAGAVTMPQVLSIIQASFTPKERGVAFGIYGAVMGIAAISGPLVGGLLIEADLFGLGWRPIFLINLPIGAAVYFSALRVVPESRSPMPVKLDLPGTFIITLGLVLLLVPLVEGRELGWPAWSFVAMAASLPVMAWFAWYEVRREERVGSALVTMSLFRRGPFVAGLLAVLSFFAGLGGFFFTFGLFLQIGNDFSPLHAALTGIPFSICSSIAAGASIRLLPRLGRNLLSIGTFLIAAGMLALELVITQAGLDFTSYTLTVPLMLCGFGFGSVAPTLVNFVLAGVEPQEIGSASGVQSTVGQLGSAIGVAVIGVIFLSSIGTAPVLPRLGAPNAAIAAPLAAAFATPVDQRRTQFLGAWQSALWGEAALYGLSFLMVFLLPRHARGEGHRPAAPGRPVAPVAT